MEMLGTDLPAWRKRHRLTQEGLKTELGIGSRQTIITWEKSSKPLPRMVELALIALERLPENRIVDGQRYATSDYAEQRARPTF